MKVTETTDKAGLMEYLGIGKGLVALMFEDYSTQLIWRLMHENEHIQRGLKRLEFRHVPRSPHSR